MGLFSSDDDCDFDDLPDGIQNIIIETTIATVSISPAGALVPALDLVGIHALWGTMFGRIANYHCISVSKEDVVNIGASVGAAVTAYITGGKILTWLLNFLPLGTLGAMAGNAVLNGYYTYALGKASHLMLESHDITGKTVVQIGKLIIHYLVPTPSISDLKMVWGWIKDHLDL